MKERKLVFELNAYKEGSKKDRLLFELFANSYRTIKSVYVFENFDEYVLQLSTDEKNDIYWNASYYEKLIDYIKICIAFESYNKAILIKEGYVVHQLKKTVQNINLFNLQRSGMPIKINDFLKTSNIIYNNINNDLIFDGLQNYLPTINFSTTLNNHHQKIIQLNNDFIYWLKEINEKRNRLHLFTEYRGAHSVRDYINKWTVIKSLAISTIETEWLKCKN